MHDLILEEHGENETGSYTFYVLDNPAPKKMFPDQTVCYADE